MYTLQFRIGNQETWHDQTSNTDVIELDKVRSDYMYQVRDAYSLPTEIRVHSRIVDKYVINYNYSIDYIRVTKKEINL